MKRLVAPSTEISRTSPSLAGLRQAARSARCGSACGSARSSPLPSLARASCKRDREAEIGNERERMRRIDRERREQREDVREEIIFQPGLLRLADIGAVDKDDAGACRAPRAARAMRLLIVAPSSTTASAMRTSCSAGVKPSGLFVPMPARTCARRPATRTMKNSSRLFAEIDRNRSRSSSGCSRLADSSRTRRLKLSQDSSRLMNRSGLEASADAACRSAGSASRWARPTGAAAWTVLECDCGRSGRDQP